MYLARLRLCNFVLLSIITISKISISYNCNQYKDMSPELKKVVFLAIEKRPKEALYIV